MALLGSSFFTVSDRPTSRRNETEASPIIVWLVGEHDLSTDDALCLTLARAIALDNYMPHVFLLRGHSPGPGLPAAAVPVVDSPVAVGSRRAGGACLRLERPPRPQPRDGG